MLHMVIGRAGTAKTTFIKQEIGKLLSEKTQGKKAVLLVPEQSNLQMEKEMTEAFGNPIGRVCEVLSFNRLCHRVFSITGNTTNTYIDSGAQKLIMGLALKKVKEQLQIFGRAAEAPVFLDNLADAQSECKSAGVTAALLCDSALHAKSPLKEKLSDLGLVFKAYEEILKQGYLDPRDDIDRMCENLQKSGFLQGKKIYIDGFWSFSAQQYRVIEQMLLAGCDVCMTLCLPSSQYTEAFGTFSGPQRTFETMQKMAKRAGQDIQITQMEEAHRFKNPELLAMEERLFSPSGEVYNEEAGHITLYTGENIFAEVEYVAGQIQRLVREQGYRYGDFVLIARDTAAYGDVLRAVFSKSRIPLYVSQREEIVTKPVLLLVLSALDTVCSRFEGDALFRLIKTGLYVLEREEGDILENYAIMWNVQGKKWRADFTMHPDGLNREFDDKSREKLKKINEMRERAMAPLLQLEKEIEAQKTAKSICGALYRFLVGAQIPQKIEALTTRLMEEGEQLALCAQYGQLWDILMNAIDQMAAIMGDAPMSPLEFNGLFSLVLSGYDVATIPTSLDEVTVGSADQICPPESKCVFLLGVNDGLFPKVRGAQGIFSEEERGQLDNLGVFMGKSTREKLFDEQFLMYSAVSIASNEVYFCCPRADMAGQALLMSQVAHTLLVLFPRLNRVEGSEIGIFDQMQSPDSIMRIAAENYYNRQHLMKKEEDYGVLYRLLESEEAFKSWNDRLTCASQKGNAPWLMLCLPENIGEKEKNLSPSKIEKFYSCHFAYYMQYLLRARVRRPIYVSGAEIGIFVHAVLEEFFQYLKDHAIADVAGQKEKRDALVQEMVTKNIMKIFRDVSIEAPRFQYLFKRLTNLLGGVIDNMLEEMSSSDFRPLEFEFDIGGEGEEPNSCHLTASDGIDVKITGKVDKIDAYEKDGRMFIRVVDYKTGAKYFDYTEVLNGLNLQMLVYLFAVCKKGEINWHKEAVPAGVLYLHVHEPVVAAEKNVTEEHLQGEIYKELRPSGLIINDTSIIEAMEHDIDGSARFIPVNITKSGGLGSYAVSPAQFACINRHVEETIKQMAALVHSGDIAINPYLKKNGQTPCTYCDFKPACLFDITDGSNGFRKMKNITREDFFKQIGGGDDGSAMD